MNALAKSRQLTREQVGINDPLRLEVAAALAYPDGSMTASGLRKEAGKGRLVIERSAGKDYTTLSEIQRMREQCRVPQKVPASGSEKPNTTKVESSRTPRHGSSKTEVIEKARAATKTILQEQKKLLKSTSQTNTRPSRTMASVHQLPSR